MLLFVTDVLSTATLNESELQQYRRRARVGFPRGGDGTRDKAHRNGNGSGDTEQGMGWRPNEEERPDEGTTWLSRKKWDTGHGTRE